MRKYIKYSNTISIYFVHPLCGRKSCSCCRVPRIYIQFRCFHSVPPCLTARTMCWVKNSAPAQRASDVTHHALRGQYWSLASSEIPEIDDCNTIPHSLAPPRPPRAAAPWAHCPRRTWWRGVASPRALLSLARRAATVPACIDSRPAMRTSACM